MQTVFAATRRPECQNLEWPGLYKVEVIPDGKSLIPPLPAKFEYDESARLNFTHCRTCTLLYDHKLDEDEDDFTSLLKIKKRHNIRKEFYKCPHTDEQRGWTGVYTHMELEQALKVGYKIKRVYHSWHWHEWSNKLFRGYVETFYKHKEEASFKGEEEDKQRIIDGFRERYGIVLERDKMAYNEGYRYLAKLCLNSVRF